MSSNYTSPKTDILEMNVEQVFAASGEPWTYDDYYKEKELNLEDYGF